jgi:hypothetical protein
VRLRAAHADRGRDSAVRDMVCVLAKGGLTLPAKGHRSPSTPLLVVGVLTDRVCPGRFVAPLEWRCFVGMVLGSGLT